MSVRPADELEVFSWIENRSSTLAPQRSRLWREDTRCNPPVWSIFLQVQRAAYVCWSGKTVRTRELLSGSAYRVETAEWGRDVRWVFWSFWASPALPPAAAWPSLFGSGTRSSPGSLWGWGSWRILLALQWTDTVSVWTFAPRPGAVRWWMAYGVYGWSCACGEDRHLPGLWWEKKLV